MSNQPVERAHSGPGRATRHGLALPAVAALCAALTACGVHWPWRHRAPPPPQPVQELSIEGGAGIQQFWDRNTLQIDLTAMSGDGTAVLRAAHGWPIRLEFKVQPGSFAQLEADGTQRAVFAVPAEGKPTLLKLSPGSYAPDTPQITIRWRAAAGSEH
ncbi:MAG: hypothetical protein WB646_21555 [Steroidobacteraceae bacterium]